MGSGQVSDQSGKSCYPVITAHSYKGAIIFVSISNYVTHQNINTTQNTLHKSTQASHKTNSAEGLQSLIALFLVIILHMYAQMFVLEKFYFTLLINKFELQTYPV